MTIFGIDLRKLSGFDFPVFSFSWQLIWPQEKLTTMLMQNFGVTNKEHYDNYVIMVFSVVVNCIISMDFSFSLLYRQVHCAINLNKTFDIHSG